MILKMTNKDENFYLYMGKFFGSRIVQAETKDRIYDDNNKLWYIYVDDQTDKATAFVSVTNNTIKNIYSIHSTYLKELLEVIKNDFVVLPSIVSNIYEKIYISCQFFITKLDNYKHFIMIRGDK